MSGAPAVIQPRDDGGLEQHDVHFVDFWKYPKKNTLKKYNEIMNSMKKNW